MAPVLETKTRHCLAVPTPNAMGCMLPHVSTALHSKAHFMQFRATSSMRLTARLVGARYLLQCTERDTAHAQDKQITKRQDSMPH